MTVSSIPLVGLAANDPVPGNYLAVNFAQGPASSGITNYSVILIGNRSTAGAATVDTVVYGPDTPVQMLNEQDVINLFGAGSELHRMWRRFTAVNKSSSLYAIAVAESAGSNATGTITFTTAATSAGTAQVIIGDVVVQSGIASGDSVTTIALNMSNQINANVNLPVTSSPSAGVITLTAKQKGPRANAIRYSASIAPVSGVGTTVSPTARTVMSGGTTYDDITNALATIANTRYYYQVVADDGYSASLSSDAAQLLLLKNQIDSNASPLVGLRCRGVFGNSDTLANVIAAATALNSARMEVAWQQNSDLTPAELAANQAAVVSLFEISLGAQSSLNFDYFGNDANTAPFWLVPAPLDGTTVSRSAVKSALLNGVSPISTSRPGISTLVKRITTRSLSGAQPDYRIRDSHKVTVCDSYADDLLIRAGLQFAGKVIGDDPLPGQRIPGPTVVTPRVFLAMVNQLTSEYSNRDLLQNVVDIQNATQVVRESSPRTRLSARVPLQVVDVLDQTATNIDQVA